MNILHGIQIINVLGITAVLVRSWGPMFRRFTLLPSSGNVMLSWLAIAVGIFFCPGRGFWHKFSRRQKWVKYFTICCAQLYSDLKKIILNAEDPVYRPLKRRNDISRGAPFCFRTKRNSFLLLISSFGGTDGFLQLCSPFTQRCLRAKTQRTRRCGRSNTDTRSLCLHV